MMASFSIFYPLNELLDELTMDRLVIIDGIEGFLFRIGRCRQKIKEWAWVAYPEAYEELLKLGECEVDPS